MDAGITKEKIEKRVKVIMCFQFISQNFAGNTQESKIYCRSMRCWSLNYKLSGDNERNVWLQSNKHCLLEMYRPTCVGCV